MRARLALAVSQQVCELREVVLARKPAELLQISPKGTVPVLLLDDGSVLEQSLDIMHWALQRHDPLGWLPVSATDTMRTQEWITHNDGPFKRQLDRYKYPARHGLDSGDTQRDAARDWLSQLDTRLRDTPHLAGQHWGLLDAALAPFIRQFAHTDPAWFANQPWPALQTWLSGFEASRLFLDCMDKQPAWVAGQPGPPFPTVRTDYLQLVTRNPAPTG
nr:glutathione S-transferase [uncultured Rhodoferax sp.]